MIKINSASSVVLFLLRPPYVFYGIPLVSILNPALDRKQNHKHNQVFHLVITNTCGINTYNCTVELITPVYYSKTERTSLHFFLTLIPLLPAAFISAAVGKLVVVPLFIERFACLSCIFRAHSSASLMTEIRLVRWFLCTCWLLACLKEMLKQLNVLCIAKFLTKTSTNPLRDRNALVIKVIHPGFKVTL